MDSFSLVSEPFLGGYSCDFDGTTLREVVDLTLISIAQPLGGQERLQKSVRSAWACALPAPGHCAVSKDETTRLLCLGPDAFFAIIAGAGAAGDVRARLGDAAYYTDQSDNWVGLQLSGPLAETALERICPIDIDPGVLPVGAFARTTMEHLGVIIMPNGNHSFLLLSASSSAKSFLHALETSIKFVG